MKNNKTESSAQMGMFVMDLAEALDQRHDLYRLSGAIRWDQFDESFDPYYSHTGRPAHAVRRMVGLLILKQLYNLSDDRVCEAWRDNPYIQYFCGETVFRWGMPCVPNELTQFRNRIGEEGVEKIFSESINLHQEKVEKEDELVADTTVQESNITYPTDVKLRRKAIEKLWKMGEKAGIKWDHSYVRTVPKLLRVTRTRSNRTQKSRRKAEKKLKTLAGRLLREFERKASTEWRQIYREELELMKRMLEQKRHDKNKVYSLHDPGVLCIAKGKAHKKYEFGRKASVTMLRDSGVIVSAVSFDENLYDGDTLPAALGKAESLCGKEFDSCLVDRGYQGRTQVGSVDIVLPYRKAVGETWYKRKKQKKRFARRSAIEPVIGHLKSDYRMARCFLKGSIGSKLNLMLSAAAWNFRKWIRESIFVYILRRARILTRRFNFSSQDLVAA